MADWMQSHIATLGPRPLRHICMPGTHDAGMSIKTGGTKFSFEGAIITQKVSIGSQLSLGSRYLDLRPVIVDGHYVSGHYSDVGGAFGWQGGNGQSFADIISQVNDFTANHKELVVLNISHDRELDSYNAFSQSQWDGLLEQLVLGLHNLFVAPDASNVDLTTLRLDQFIGQGKAAVVVVVQPDDGGVTLGSYVERGFYKYSQYDAYNSYAEKNTVDEMATDQLLKMHSVRTDPDKQLFLLSWTLTGDNKDAVVSLVADSYSVLGLAAAANRELLIRVPIACSRHSFPNIIYVDGLETDEVLAVAMLINAIVDTI